MRHFNFPSSRCWAAWFASALLLTGSIVSCLAQPAVLEAEAPAEAATGMKTVAVVGIKSYDGVMGDIGYLGGLAGRPEGAQMIEGMLALFTQGKGLAGVDKTRPWGIVLQTDGTTFAPLVVLPVDDLQATLEIVQAFGVLAEDAGDGVTELSMPDQTLYAKEQDGWVFLAQNEAALESAPADPMPVMAKLVTDYDIGIQAIAKNVPDMFKQIAVQQMRAGLEAGLEREEDETDEQFATKKQLAEAQVEGILRLVEDTDELTLGIAVNNENAPGMLIDMSISAAPGTKLGDQMSSMKATPTDFAGFVKKDATMWLLQSTQTPAENLESVVTQAKPQLAAAKKQMYEAIDQLDELPNEEARDTLKEAIDDVMVSMEATVETGRSDVGGYMAMTPGSFQAVMGMTISKPEKMEEALKKLASLAEDQPDFPGVQWNALSHAGLNFHTMNVPVPDAEAREIMGDNIEVVVATGAEKVCIAVGEDGIAALKKALDDSASMKGKTVPPVQMEFSVKQAIDFATKVAKGPEAAGIAMAAKTFEDVSDEEGRVSVLLEPVKNGARYRIQIAEGVLKGIAQAVNLAAAQAQQGGGEF